MFADYLALKTVHVSCAALSYMLFFVRGVWMIRGAALVQARWSRVVPHAIDTVLLASAIAMVVVSAQYPFVQPWLTAKVLALVAYVGLGMLALHGSRTPRGRIPAWLAAQAVFVYIVAVAVTRDPAPWRHFS